MIPWNEKTTPNRVRPRECVACARDALDAAYNIPERAAIPLLIEAVDWLRRALEQMVGEQAQGADATPKCSGYCVGTASVDTLVEDLACPVHGIDAQERAKSVYPDRQAWLDALAGEQAQGETT